MKYTEYQIDLFDKVFNFYIDHSLKHIEKRNPSKELFSKLFSIDKALAQTAINEVCNIGNELGLLVAQEFGYGDWEIVSMDKTKSLTFQSQGGFKSHFKLKDMSNPNFTPNLKDIAFDSILNYLYNTKNCEPVPHTEFHNHFSLQYPNDINIFMKLLKNQHLITYNDMAAQIVPVEITGLGKDFIAKTSFVEEAKKQFDKEQKQGITQNFINENYGQVGGHQSSFDNAFISPTIQKNKNPSKQIKTKTSPIEIASWIFGIIVAILAIYEFIIKNLIK
jgi:hypothetical protein